MAADSEGWGMGLQFEVVDLRTDLICASEMVEGAASPEEAARRVLGIDVFRSGKRQDLVARVYWQRRGEPKNMVRLYSRPYFQ
ncbi:hypothetical protein [Devosia chinhatensis]|uniref:Uncharacterized protein n=1 Tax=Devosia chinhatensis TaxID=429727 RepID=A0A0F5FEZ4_9HYPH|nr:hypothetical protein [Devosia chinhatensis]KKB07368.1 hypothetical protein VE26_11340 [Devosia chinhatensis]